MLSQSAEFDIIRDGGALAVLVWGIVGFLRGWIVSGREFQAMRRDRDTWREQALKSVRVAERGVDVAERVAHNLPSSED